MTTLVIEGHTRMQPCVSPYTLDMQVEKECHIPAWISPYIESGIRNPETNEYVFLVPAVSISSFLDAEASCTFIQGQLISNQEM